MLCPVRFAIFRRLKASAKTFISYLSRNRMTLPKRISVENTLSPKLKAPGEGDSWNHLTCRGTSSSQAAVVVINEAS